MFMGINTRGQRNACPLNNTEKDTDYYQYRGPLGSITTDHVKDTFNATTQLTSYFIRVPLRKNFRYQFSQMNHQRLTDE